MRYLRHLILLLAVLSGPTMTCAKPLEITLLADQAALGDPQRRPVLDSLIEGLADRLDADSRLSLSLYAATAREVRSLQPVTENTGQDMIHALNTLAPAASTANPAVALEQTIYRLRTAGRDQAEQRIVVLGDGLIDTGDARHNAELAEWLHEELSNEARRSGIRIDWLTFSEAADYRIIQRLTQKSGGSYYRAYGPAETIAAVDGLLAASRSAPAASPSTVSTGREVPQPQPKGPWNDLKTKLSGHWPVIAGTSGLMLVLLVGAFTIRKRTHSRQGGKTGSRDKDSQAVLRDLSQFTSLSEYDITDRRTYIGRHPREVTERSCVIIISDSSVGRSHATIDCRDNQYWLTDLDTVNGTYLNGERISGARQLTHGDKIRFARFEFAVSLPAQHAARYTDTLYRTHTTTDTLPDDERTVFRPRQ
jgi:hypothetical protein